MFEKVYELVNELNRLPNVYLRVVSQTVDSLKLEITLTGSLMKTYMQLGEIQSRFKKIIKDDFEFTTVYGDGQDALFIINKNK